jgi:cell division protein ZapE
LRGLDHNRRGVALEREFGYLCCRFVADRASEMTEGPLFALRDRVRAGALQHDAIQLLAAEKLQSLRGAIGGYQPATGMAGWKTRFGLGRRPEEPPQGLYIYGPVGRGKSMLMDLFFETAEVEHKRRIHFHEFMIEVHDHIHTWNQAGGKKDGAGGDSLHPVADRVAAEAWLLCFDEFRVTNIADAMILGRLFEALFARGVVVVSTSNFAPDDLYAGGLQRERFVPFIELFKQRLDLLELASPKDYRLQRLKAMAVYHTPLGPTAAAALEGAFARLTEGARAGPDRLTVKGRVIEVAEAARGVARLGFEQLCARTLGAEDYIALAQRYHTIILSDVPIMGEDLRNEAHRFMTLIDALYEHHVNLVLSAAAEPQGLHRGDTHAFEFQRTMSRLMEMRSLDYIEAAHGAVPGA